MHSLLTFVLFSRQCSGKIVERVSNLPIRTRSILNRNEGSGGSPYSSFRYMQDIMYVHPLR